MERSRGYRRNSTRQEGSRGDMSQASFLSLIPSPIAQTYWEARGQRRQGMPSAGSARAGLRRTENGLGKGADGEALRTSRNSTHRHLPSASGHTAAGDSFPECSLPGAVPRPHRAPPIWQGGPHTPTLRRSMDTSPKAKWKWLLDYPPVGWIICTIASDRY